MGEITGPFDEQWLQDVGVPDHNDQDLAQNLATENIQGHNEHEFGHPLNAEGHNEQDGANGFDNQLILNAEGQNEDEDDGTNGFGNLIGNLPHEDLNWAMHDQWKQDLEQAHVDQGLSLEILGNNKADGMSNVIVDLPHLELDIDDNFFDQWLPPHPEAPDLNEIAGDDELDEQEEQEGFGNVIEGDDGAGNGEQVNVFAMGLQHLRNSTDARISALIDEHPQLPIFDGQNMTAFQKLLRALVEEGGSRANMANRYAELRLLCHDNVNQLSMALLGVKDFIGIGVQGQYKAQAILNFAASFANNDEIDIDELLHRDSQNLFRRFHMVNGVGPYGALHVLLYGAERLDFMPIGELNLRSRIECHYHNANLNYELWNPYQGLAAWRLGLFGLRCKLEEREAEIT